MNLETRFWRHVECSAGCWLWTGQRNVKGYGRIENAGRRRRAHRVSWELHNGPIPDGLLVCHRCDNPSCVRPDHLFLGTQVDNMRDCASKGRAASGERVANAKLTADQVSELLRRLEDGESQRALAKRFEVGRATVQDIVSHRTWRTSPAGGRR